jgi:hypothetical protein
MSDKLLSIMYAIQEEVAQIHQRLGVRAFSMCNSLQFKDKQLT